MDSPQVGNMKNMFSEQRSEFNTVLDGLEEHIMLYVGSDVTQSAAATNLLLHQKALFRLMSTLVQDLRTGKIFKPKFRKPRQRKDRGSMQKMTKTPLAGTAAAVVELTATSAAAASDTVAFTVAATADKTTEPIVYMEEEEGFNYNVIE